MILFRNALSNLPSRWGCDLSFVAELPLSANGLPSCVFARPQHPIGAELSRLLAPPFPVHEGRIAVFQPIGECPLTLFLEGSYNLQRRDFCERRSPRPPGDYSGSANEWSAFTHLVSLSATDNQPSDLCLATLKIQCTLDDAVALANTNRHSAALVYIDCALAGVCAASTIAMLTALYLHPRGRVIVFANASEAESSYFECLQRILAKEHDMATVSTQVSYDVRIGTRVIDSSRGYVLVGRNAESDRAPLSVSTAAPAPTVTPALSRPKNNQPLPKISPDLRPVAAQGIQWARLPPEDRDGPTRTPTRPRRRDPQILPTEPPRPTRGGSVF